MSEPRYIVNVEGAILRADRYLVVVRGEQEEHAAGTLSLVGGKVELNGPADAVLEATLAREISEEVGVRIAPQVEYLESKAFIDDTGMLVIDVVFLCRYQSGTPRILQPDEVAELGWLTAEEIAGHPRTPAWTRQSIALAERKRRAQG